MSISTHDVINKLDGLKEDDKDAMLAYIYSSFDEILEEAKWVNLLKKELPVLDRLALEAEEDIRLGKFEEFNP